MTHQKMDYRAMLAKRDEFVSNIVAKAMEDDAFRRELVQNPKASIEAVVFRSKWEFQKIRAAVLMYNLSYPLNQSLRMGALL
jgi:hypothetical protein